MTDWFTAESVAVVISVTAAAVYIAFRIKDGLVRALGSAPPAAGCNGCACAAQGCGLRSRTPRPR